MTDGITRPTETTDVLVVGAGAAGLITAIEAADLGTRVIVVQKLPEAGGKSALAIGSISAAGTSLQRSHGIVDSTEQHHADLDRRLAKGDIAPLSMDKLRTVVDFGADAVERLIGLGIALNGPHPEFRDEVWRMHVVQPNTRAMIATLTERARSRGVRLRYDWPVDELIVDHIGRVVGVTGPMGRALATRAVVLATGDFSSPSRLGLPSPVGSDFAFRPWSSGDGHFLAHSVGAELVNTDAPLRPQIRTVDWPHIEPQAALFRAGAVLVDRTGSRVVDELDQPARALVDSGIDDVFLVMDSTVIDQIAVAAEDSAFARDGWLTTGKLYIGTFPGVAYGYVADVVGAGYGAICDSEAELAATLGVSSHGLADTMRSAEQPTAGPYFGFGPLRARSILGRAGIRCDGEFRPVTPDGLPIAGLFVVGAAAGATGFAYGHGYELAWAVVSGRGAGRLAAGDHSPSSR